MSQASPEATSPSPEATARWREAVMTHRDPSDVPQVNLHVFGPNCPETERHRMFRDWLRTQPEDRDEYRHARLAAASATGEQLVMDYNQHKEPTIRRLYERMFRAAGWLDGAEPSSSDPKESA